MATSGTAQQAKPSTAFHGLGRIDVHHHCFPSSVPQLQPEFAQKGRDSGVAFTWSDFPGKPEDHLEYLDKTEAQTAIITPSIQKVWHNDLRAEEWAKLCEDSLDAQLEYVQFNPLRFGCFAMLPLPHIDETLKFIKNASNRPILPDGFGVTTAMGQKYLGDPAFEPVWAELDKLGSVVFVHPADTQYPPNLSYGPFVQEYPFDTCRAITNAITSGILQRYQNLKFLFSHNGGAFPFLADRIGAQHLDEQIAKNNDGLRLRQILSTKNIYLDTSISSSMQYPVLQDLGLPTEHLLYATDYPYTVRRDTTSCYQVGYEAPKGSGLFDEKDMEGILRENALKLFPRLAKEFGKIRQSA